MHERLSNFQPSSEHFDNILVYHQILMNEQKNMLNLLFIKQNMKREKMFSECLLLNATECDKVKIELIISPMYP